MRAFDKGKSTRPGRDDTRTAAAGLMSRLSTTPTRVAAISVTGVVAAALALTGALHAKGSDDDAQESTAPAPVILTADGFAPAVKAADVTELLPVAKQALAGTLAPPAGADGSVPDRLLEAYRRGEATADQQRASCHVPWWVLAGIVKVETDNLKGATIAEDGATTPAVRGARLDGTVLGTRLVIDTDQGVLDGDTSYDRAMGPLQFLPGSWRVAGRDGNGDGVVSADNIDDAAVSAAGFLCRAGDDLAVSGGLATALLRHDPRPSYAEEVLAWGTYYRTRLTPPSQPPAPPSTARVAPIPPKPTEAAQPTPTPSDTPTVSPAPTRPEPAPSGSSTPDPRPSSPRPTTPRPAQPAPTGTADPAPHPKPTPKPKPKPTPKPTPKPDPKPEPTPKPTPAPAPDPTPSPKPTDTGEPAPRPTNPGRDTTDGPTQAPARDSAPTDRTRD